MDPLRRRESGCETAADRCSRGKWVSDSCMSEHHLTEAADTGATLPLRSGSGRVRLVFAASVVIQYLSLLVQLHCLVIIPVLKN